MPVLGFDIQLNAEAGTLDSSPGCFHAPSFIIYHFESLLQYQRGLVSVSALNGKLFKHTDVWVLTARHGIAPENLRVRPSIGFPSQEQIGAGTDKFLPSHLTWKANCTFFPPLHFKQNPDVSGCERRVLGFFYCFVQKLGMRAGMRTDRGESVSFQRQVA